VVGMALFHLGQCGKALLGFLQCCLELCSVHTALLNLLIDFSNRRVGFDLPKRVAQAQ
jgi:hypothetical protein